MNFCVLGAALMLAQLAPNGPAHDSGQSVTPAFEGWFRNADGTFSILFGYYNRNQKQELDIAVGPENRIEPGGPDRGQPTHFLPKRQWGMFTLIVPKDFAEGKIVWTLTANGKTTSIPASLDARWELSPFVDATGNTPPFLAFHREGPFGKGPAGAGETIVADAGNSAIVTLFAADDAHVTPGASTPKSSPVAVTWSKFRGPGAVTFSEGRPSFEKADFEGPPNTAFRGKATTTFTFSEPGVYVLNAQANDWSGEGGRGFQCCWSNAKVTVTVRSR